ncbi:hypothetical protein PGTUg99_032250 [Puccinia graminis f. sp. tritici]|uniref:Uncharacterized protein n=2 Tax=Puccinia graminis f. sp. tritici TaxID=56615 RepID=E3L6K2_PUCGT|nr:uncharacterized protein PGTG_17907 [Puccinia graminis f. sp. tritici CRL 75-36-700-3]EFP92177.2 hypothetical protein PGTG_17907 [Puccinia graminis f. sp. tritici CRL 75-36-700-3]KAA1138633.1 hypothetical protein PGTUg99_032250 [Puccinia graminis f. sp. tritici]
MNPFNPFRYISIFLLPALLSNVCLGLPPPRQTPLDTYPDNIQPNLRAGTNLTPNVTNLDNNNTTSNSTTVGNPNINSNSINPGGSILNSSTTNENDPDYDSSDDEDLDDDDYENDWSEEPPNDDVSNNHDCDPDAPIMQSTSPDDPTINTTENQRSNSTSGLRKDGGKVLVAPNSTNPGEGSSVGGNHSSSDTEHNTAHRLLINLHGTWQLTLLAVLGGNLLIMM